MATDTSAHRGALETLNLAEAGDPYADIRGLLTEWEGYFEDLDLEPLDPSRMSDWVAEVEDPDCQKKLELAKAASEDPVYGLALALAALVGAVKRTAQPYWSFLFAAEGEEESAGIFDWAAEWNIKELPAPKKNGPVEEEDGPVDEEEGPAEEEDGPAVKYLIVSDLHRDAGSDDLGPFQRGSIDHFKANHRLYEGILDFAYANGYTLVEAGDCEELWFIRDPGDPTAYPSIAKKLKEIIESHPGVYDRLRTLNEEGRYYRTCGNHDSFLKPHCDAGPDPSDPNAETVAEILQATFGNSPDDQTPDGRPFEIYDAFVIPGVKSMMDTWDQGIVGDAIEVATGQMTPEEFVENRVKGALGMDASGYTNTTRMVVMHGHQFDFWNKPENEILGILIANSVGMMVDRNMDPFLDVRGIAAQGNPWIDFAFAFAGWPVFNSWLSREPSLRFAHDVQHMPNRLRGLSDSIMFSESRAAFWGAFGIALNHQIETPDGGTLIITPKASRSDPEYKLDLTTPSGLAEYLNRHYLHHICIGHTHNPHSQPYATLANLAALAFPQAAPDLLVKALLWLPIPRLKTTYLNSGTGGWMEGVIWAIEIDETGQARLVYWTDNGVEEPVADGNGGQDQEGETGENGEEDHGPEYRIWGPTYMDWELQPLPDEYKQGLEEGLRTALLEPTAEVSENVQALYELLEERFEELSISLMDKADALSRTLTLPIQSLAGALVQAPLEIEKRLKRLKEVSEPVFEKIDELKDELGKLQEFNFDALLSAKRHAFLGFSSTTGIETETLVIQAPISSEARDRLERFQRILVQMGASQDQALHAAGIALAMFDQFPGNVPFFSSMLEPVDPGGMLQASESPVLHSLLSTLWMYPPAGDVVEVMGIRITSNFTLGPADVTLTVVIEPGAGPTEPDEPGDGPPPVS